MRSIYSPKFDLIVLGIGEDGHTASLFPGSRVLSDKERLAVAVQSRKTQHRRITLTLPVLNSARNIVFLVSGKRKASIMKKVLMLRVKSLPASLINPDHGKYLFLTDKAASTYILNNSAMNITK